MIFAARLAPLFIGFVMLALSSTGLAQDSDNRTDRVLSQAEQEALTSGQVLQILIEGNQVFTRGTLTSRDHSALVRDAVAGQFPKAIVLSCIDSRIPVEDVFDLSIGDVFVARVAGNFENTDILGSMEYATRVVGAKLILVLGHQDCGAIKAAIDQVQLGNITAMLENIRPAVDALSDYPGDQSSSNPEFVHLVSRKNILLTMENILERSPLIREMVDEGEVRIVGAMYSMKTGLVEFYD